MPPRGNVVLKSISGSSQHLHLTVPTALVREHKLEAGMEFHVVVNDQGILYEPVDPQPVPDTRPEWLR